MSYEDDLYQEREFNEEGHEEIGGDFTDDIEFSSQQEGYEYEEPETVTVDRKPAWHFRHGLAGAHTIKAEAPAHISSPDISAVVGRGARGVIKGGGDAGKPIRSAPALSILSITGSPKTETPLERLVSGGLGQITQAEEPISQEAIDRASQQAHINKVRRQDAAGVRRAEQAVADTIRHNKFIPKVDQYGSMTNEEVEGLYSPEVPTNNVSVVVKKRRSRSVQPVPELTTSLNTKSITADSPVMFTPSPVIPHDELNDVTASAVPRGAASGIAMAAHRFGSMDTGVQAAMQSIVTGSVPSKFYRGHDADPEYNRDDYVAAPIRFLNAIGSTNSQDLYDFADMLQGTPVGNNEVTSRNPDNSLSSIESQGNFSATDLRTAYGMIISHGDYLERGVGSFGSTKIPEVGSLADTELIDALAHVKASAKWHNRSEADTHAALILKYNPKTPKEDLVHTAMVNSTLPKGVTWAEFNAEPLAADRLARKVLTKFARNLYVSDANWSGDIFGTLGDRGQDEAGNRQDEVSKLNLDYRGSGEEVTQTEHFNTLIDAGVSSDEALRSVAGGQTSTSLDEHRLSPQPVNVTGKYPSRDKPQVRHTFATPPKISANPYAPSGAIDSSVSFPKVHGSFPYQDYLHAAPSEGGWFPEDYNIPTKVGVHNTPSVSSQVMTTDIARFRDLARAEPEPDTPEWMAARQGLLTASAVHTLKSKLTKNTDRPEYGEVVNDLYVKTANEIAMRQAGHNPFYGNEATKAGHRYEQATIDSFAKLPEFSDKQYLKAPFMTNSNFPGLGATPDSLVFSSDGKLEAVLEAKSLNYGIDRNHPDPIQRAKNNKKADAALAAASKKYAWQVQAQMMVVGVQSGVLVVNDLSVPEGERKALVTMYKPDEGIRGMLSEAAKVVTAMAGKITPDEALTLVQNAKQARLDNSKGGQVDSSGIVTETEYANMGTAAPQDAFVAPVGEDDTIQEAFSTSNNSEPEVRSNKPRGFNPDDVKAVEAMSSDNRALLVSKMASERIQKRELKREVDIKEADMQGVDLVGNEIAKAASDKADKAAKTQETNMRKAQKSREEAGRQLRKIATGVRKGVDFMTKGLDDGLRDIRLTREAGMSDDDVSKVRGVRQLLVQSGAVDDDAARSIMSNVGDYTSRMNDPETAAIEANQMYGLIGKLGYSPGTFGSFEDITGRNMIENVAWIAGLKNKGVSSRDVANITRQMGAKQLSVIHGSVTSDEVIGANVEVQSSELRAANKGLWGVRFDWENFAMNATADDEITGASLGVGAILGDTLSVSTKEAVAKVGVVAAMAATKGMGNLDQEGNQIVDNSSLVGAPNFALTPTKYENGVFGSSNNVVPSGNLVGVDANSKLLGSGSVARTDVSIVINEGEGYSVETTDTNGLKVLEKGNFNHEQQ